VKHKLGVTIHIGYILYILEKQDLVKQDTARQQLGHSQKDKKHFKIGETARIIQTERMYGSCALPACILSEPEFLYILKS
jgi:hypothetical protein